MNTKPPITGRPRCGALPLQRPWSSSGGPWRTRHVVEVLNRQKDITDAIAKKQRVEGNGRGYARGAGAASKGARQGGKPQAEDGTGNKDKKKASAPPPQRDDIVGELKGYVRLAAWPRQSLQTPDPNKADFKLKFGNPDEVKEEKPEPSVLDKLKKMTKKGGKLKAKKTVNVHTGPSYKTVIGFNYLLAQAPQGDRPLFYDKDSATLKHRGGWNAWLCWTCSKKRRCLRTKMRRARMCPSAAWRGLASPSVMVWM